MVHLAKLGWLQLLEGSEDYLRLSGVRFGRGGARVEDPIMRVQEPYLDPPM